MLRTFERRVPRVHPTAFVHDSAEVIGDVVLGPRASVWPLCVLRGDISRISVGEGSNIQDLSVIHTREGHPTVVGRRVTVGHRVTLHGARIGDGCLIGMGAIVMEARIGPRSLVAAGSLVLAGMRVPAQSLVVGSPARVRRRLSDAEVRDILRGQRSYLRKLGQHKRSSHAVLA